MGNIPSQRPTGPMQLVPTTLAAQAAPKTRPQPAASAAGAPAPTAAHPPATPARAGFSPTDQRASFPVAAAGAPQAAARSPLDNRATFFNGNAANAAEIRSVLQRYNSPHVGQAETIARICREENINPVLLLAVMQKESSYGNTANNPGLKPENITNPWSVHFNESAPGIAKLNLPNGQPPSFEQSLRGAISTLKRHAGNSETPLSATSVKYCPPHAQQWATEVSNNFSLQLRRIEQSRH